MNGVEEITVRQLKGQIERGKVPVLLDVREQCEYDIVNLNGILIPLDQLPARVKELDVTAETVVYCHHGRRSWYAAEFLQQQGFTRVKSLAGGIDAWSEQIDPSMPRY